MIIYHQQSFFQLINPFRQISISWMTLFSFKMKVWVLRKKRHFLSGKWQNFSSFLFFSCVFSCCINRRSFFQLLLRFFSTTYLNTMAVTNLLFIQNQLIKYGMYTYLVLGIAGNIFNCIMFTRPTYRRTPGSTFLLCLAIFDIIYLIWNMFPYLYSLDHIDPQIQSSAYCKIR